MAIIKEPTNIDDTANYIASLAFFYCISSVILMLKFGGFKATLNVFGGKRTNKECCGLDTDAFVGGAYRTNKDEFFRYDNSSVQPKKLSTNAPSASLKTAKSSNDLAKPVVVPSNLRHSTPNVSHDPRGAEQVDVHRNPVQTPKDLKNQEKEQKKLEKQRLAEHKAREKAAAQEQAKQEKLRREREKKEAQQAKRKEKNDRRKPPAPQPQRTNPIAQTQVQHARNSTSTLESSISRTTGPPPYSENPRRELAKKQSDKTDNARFNKPTNDTGSWDMVTQHREQINRPATSGGAQSKQTVMDLNYNFGGNLARREPKDNSEA